MTPEYIHAVEQPFGMTDRDDGPSFSFVGEPEDTRERIMQATFETVQAHGFAGLSIGRIADRADLSKSSVYHFYDGKDDLLLAFLDAMLAQFGGPLADADFDDPETELWTLVDFGLYGTTGEQFPPVDGVGDVNGRPYVELRSQATHDDEYRDRFTDIDASMHERLATVIDRGIDDGVFRPVDPDRTAQFLLTVLLGGLFRRATSDGLDADAVRAELEAVVDDRLLSE